MINPPFNYTGSKFKLLDQILPLLDYNKEYFIDLFCGGGSVYTNVLDKYQKILINDILEELIGIHQKLAIEPYIFIEDVKKLAITKYNQQLYIDLRKSFNDNKTPEKLYSLLLTCTNKRAKIIDNLIADGFNYKILNFDYEGVARNKKSKNSQEILIYNYDS